MKPLAAVQLSRVLSEHAGGTLSYFGSWHGACRACVAEAATTEPVLSARERLLGRPPHVPPGDAWWAISEATKGRRWNGDPAIYSARSADALLRALEKRGLA